MCAASGLASIIVDDKVTPCVSDELRVKITETPRRAFLTPVLVIALLMMVAGGGFAIGFILQQPNCQSTIAFDVDAEIDVILLTCTQSDLAGDADTVSDP